MLGASQRTPNSQCFNLVSQVDCYTEFPCEVGSKVRFEGGTPDSCMFVGSKHTRIGSMWCFYVVLPRCTLQGSHSDHSDLNLRHWNGFCCFPTDVFERIRGSNKAEVQLNNFWQDNRARCNGFPSLIPVKFRSSHSVSYSASPTHRGESNLGGGFKCFLFSTLPGKSSDLTNIFQVGWNTN